MQFIKTICVLVVLGALAYGAYTTLTGKPKNDPPVETANWDSPPRIELPGGGEAGASSTTSAPTGPAGGGAPRYGATTTDSPGTARITPGGPLTGSTLPPTSTASTVAPYPVTNSVPGRFDGGGAVHLINAPSASPSGTSATSAQGPALVAPAGGPWPGSSMPNALQPTSGTTSTSGPVNAAEAIAKGQACLAKNDLLHALDEFSKCFDNPTLASTDASRVHDLLGQLAGTVIYSRDHLLEPAHTVAAGETLQGIADKHQVSAGLLAKINGIADPLYLPAGTQLKMVKGPFDAVVDKGHGKITLFLDGMFAGSFPLTPGFDCPDGNYTVERTTKQIGANGSGGNAPVAYAILLTGGPVLCGSDDPSMPTSLTPGASMARAMTLRDAEEVCDILSSGSRIVIRK